MKLFISYSRVDKPICKAVVERLSAHEVWFDENLYGGEKWWEKIEEKLDWCEGFIYLLSTESISSEYCEKEYKLADELGKQIIPVIVRARTEMPITLKVLQRVELTEITVNSVTDLLNAVLIAERTVNLNTKKIIHKPNSPINSNLTIDYGYRLENQEKLSELTRDTYFRWIDNFLVVIASYTPSYGKQERRERMKKLSLGLLVDGLKIGHIRIWLGMIAASSHNGTAIVQAKAAIKQLITAITEHGYLDSAILQEIDTISFPKKFTKYVSKRHLSQKEIERLISNSLEMATSDAQAKRNKLLMLMFCYLLMKPNEVAKLSWEQTEVNASNQTLSLYKPDAHLTIEAPASAYSAYNEWLNAFPMSIKLEFNLTPVIRATMKNGHIKDQGISPRNVGIIVAQAASKAGLGDVTPLDIRQSVAQIMVKEKILSIDIVSRLFGHARGKATSQLFDKTQAQSINEIIKVPEFLNL